MGCERRETTLPQNQRHGTGEATALARQPGGLRVQPLIAFGGLVDDDLRLDQNQERTFIAHVGAVVEQTVDDRHLGEDRHADFPFGLARGVQAAEQQRSAVGAGDGCLELLNNDGGKLDRQGLCGRR